MFVEVLSDLFYMIFPYRYIGDFPFTRFLLEPKSYLAENWTVFQRLLRLQIFKFKFEMNVHACTTHWRLLHSSCFAKHLFITQEVLTWILVYLNIFYFNLIFLSKYFGTIQLALGCQSVQGSWQKVIKCDFSL